MRHDGIDIRIGPTFDARTCPLDRRFEPFKLFGGKRAEHVLVLWDEVRVIDTDAQAREGACLEPKLDVGQAVVATGGAGGPQADLPAWQGRVIDYDQAVVRVELVVVQGGAQGHTASIHIGGGTQENTRRTKDVTLCHDGVELSLRAVNSVMVGKAIDRLEADVVTVPGILASRVSQTHDQLHFKDHL